MSNSKVLSPRLSGFGECFQTFDSDLWTERNLNENVYCYGRIYKIGVQIIIIMEYQPSENAKFLGGKSVIYYEPIHSL